MPRHFLKKRWVLVTLQSVFVFVFTYATLYLLSKNALPAAIGGTSGFLIMEVFFRSKIDTWKMSRREKKQLNH